MNLQVVTLVHATNAFPEYPGSHAHWGIWFVTWHDAWIPHTPGHGSLHFLLTQALSFGHSELTVHSGLHSIYGFPI